MGICSTTYGDLVCRGCKRFAHEIVGWNGFDDDQRRVVWERLHELRDGATLCHVEIVDPDCLAGHAERLRIPDLESLSPGNLAYEVLRRSRSGASLEDLGLRAAPAAPALTAPLYQRIEQELFERSQAHYERYFHVPVQ